MRELFLLQLIWKYPSQILNLITQIPFYEAGFEM